MSSRTCRHGRVMLRAMGGRKAAGEWTGSTTLMRLGWNYNVAWGAARPRRLGYPKPCAYSKSCHRGDACPLPGGLSSSHGPQHDPPATASTRIHSTKILSAGQCHVLSLASPPPQTEATTHRPVRVYHDSTRNLPSKPSSLAARDTPPSSPPAPPTCVASSDRY